MALNQCAGVRRVEMCFAGNWFCESDNRSVVSALEKEVLGDLYSQKDKIAP